MIPPYRGTGPHRRPRVRPSLAAPACDGPIPDDPEIPQFLIDGAPPPVAIRASEAARGFSAGNGYIPGLIVDRLA